MESNLKIWLAALRHSHQGLADLVDGLDLSDLERQSACTEWSVAQVLSHTGSGAEIFMLLLEAGLAGTDAPSNERFVPIWEKWNARTPFEQSRACVEVNAAFIERVMSLDDTTMDALHIGAFGMVLDAATLLRFRLSELAIHLWDVAVAFDANAKIRSDAVNLIIDGAPQTAAWTGTPAEHRQIVKVRTRDPERIYALVTSGIGFDPWISQQHDVELELASETLIRLIYGRFREEDVRDITLTGNGLSLDEIRGLFRGL